MKNNIIVALDGSDGGKRALAVAATYAKLTESKIYLCYIIDWSPYSFHTPQELEERQKRRDSEMQRANEQILQPEVPVLIDMGLSVETIVRHGKVANALSHLANEHHASQIYIGRLGESRVQSMIFGSVTAALIQSSEVPVTVVP
jgi:nucleotide-binding universal stress UspA family protein